MDEQEKKFLSVSAKSTLANKMSGGLVLTPTALKKSWKSALLNSRSKAVG